MRAGVDGRSCARAAKVGVMLHTSWAAEHKVGLGWGVAACPMLTRHMPWRMMRPELSRTHKLCLSKDAVHPLSYSGLIRLLVNPGIMCPVQAAVGMCVGSAKHAEAVDVLVSPVAVRMVVRGAVLSMHESGALGVK